MDRGALKLKGVEVEFGSMEESFMLQVVDHEKKIRFYESMLIAMSSMNVDREKYTEFMQEYSSLLWPEVEEAEERRASFAERAVESFSRFSGKPFLVRPEGDEGGTIIQKGDE